MALLECVHIRAGEEILRFAQNDIWADLVKRVGGLLLTKAVAWSRMLDWLNTYPTQGSRCNL